VGLTAKFFFELEDALTYAPEVVHKKVGVFTGVSGLPAMNEGSKKSWKKVVGVGVYTHLSRDKHVLWLRPSP
jgi:hypothetical protein